MIPWFSKTEGNTYATLLHHPFLFKGKPTQCSRGSTKPKTSSRIQSHLPCIYIICHLPFVFLSPTSPLSFYLPSLSQSPPLFIFRISLFTSLFARVLVCLLVTMVLPKFGDLHLKRLEEIESNVRSFMVLSAILLCSHHDSREHQVM